MEAERLKRFAELAKRKREVEGELDRIRVEMSELEEYLKGEFEKSGISSTTVDGVTCYLHRQLWAKARGGEYARACSALREAGLGQMVEEKFNTQTLSAWVREQEASDIELPPALKEVIEVSEVFSVRTRKAS